MALLWSTLNDIMLTSATIVVASKSHPMTSSWSAAHITEAHVERATSTERRQLKYTAERPTISTRWLTRKTSRSWFSATCRASNSGKPGMAVVTTDSTRRFTSADAHWPWFRLASYHSSHLSRISRPTKPVLSVAVSGTSMYAIRSIGLSSRVSDLSVTAPPGSTSHWFSGSSIVLKYIWPFHRCPLSRPCTWPTGCRIQSMRSG
mmetsp:Transcript_18607/g.63405  ORF Transcript_18607/g.63405 Transcript_18607/m.63405 type:complete len:205 (+) Transcript_18607:428-1042(+)